MPTAAVTFVPAPVVARLSGGVTGRAGPVVTTASIEPVASPFGLLTEASILTVVPIPATTSVVSTRVRDAPAGIAPMVQRSGAPAQPHVAGVAETSTRPAGNVSSAVTALASTSPRLATSTSQAACPAAGTGPTARNATCSSVRGSPAAAGAASTTTSAAARATRRANRDIGQHPTER
jgi:hypothetical protein